MRGHFTAHRARRVNCGRAKAAESVKRRALWRLRPREALLRVCAMDDFLREIEDAARTGEDLQSLLARVADAFACQAGTIHLLRGNLLHLAAHRGIPPEVLEQIGVVPVGKGMAGLAVQRREPVQVCDLQTDASGVARPGAKATPVSGSLVVPMMTDDGGEVRGALGVARAEAHAWTPEECAALLRAGALLAAVVQR